mmetsp:Transcript_70963/g.118662  ORF Transcript_70963/g.118662 Transcript_70963/m.118662 type:complete len:91 (-) Transcript_70963:221-493(-)
MTKAISPTLKLSQCDDTDFPKDHPYSAEVAMYSSHHQDTLRLARVAIQPLGLGTLDPELLLPVAFGDHHPTPQPPPACRQSCHSQFALSV